MRQMISLANSKGSCLEEDGEGVSAKKILRQGGRIQNYVFKFLNRANSDEAILNRETVMNIKNSGTGLFLSTDVVKSVDEDEEEEEGGQDKPEAPKVTRGDGDGGNQ
jgi:hypothetical protein